MWHTLARLWVLVSLLVVLFIASIADVTRLELVILKLNLGSQDSEANAFTQCMFGIGLQVDTL